MSGVKWRQTPCVTDLGHLLNRFTPRLEKGAILASTNANPVFFPNVMGPGIVRQKVVQAAEAVLSEIIRFQMICCMHTLFSGGFII